jgi:hypothetical protein
MSKILQEVKSSKSNLELANKHCFIFATIHVGPSSSMSGIVKVLGLHPRNIANALERCKIASNSGIPLWSLLVRKRKIDDCTIDVKNVAIAWWASETRVSHNKDDVTRKCLETGMYDEKPTHFLMETQVMCTNTLSFILF